LEVRIEALEAEKEQLADYAVNVGKALGGRELDCLALAETIRALEAGITPARG